LAATADDDCELDKAVSHYKKAWQESTKALERESTEADEH